METKRTIVLGKGFISSHLNYTCIDTRIFPDIKYINEFLDHKKPDCIISCIGYCGGKNVDGCEIDKHRTIECNTTVPIMLATECDKRGIHFINIASGCIFDGEKSPYKQVPVNEDKHKFNHVKEYTLELAPFGDVGWSETDTPTPVSFYAFSKYAADLVIAGLPNVCTLRIRMPISNKPNGRNLINKLIGYPKIVDVKNSVTFLADLSRCVDWVVENRKAGIYHITNPEPLSPPEILEEYQKYVPTHTFEKVNVEELSKLVVAKRSNCLIDTSKLNKEGFIMSPTREMLEKTMKEYCSNK